MHKTLADRLLESATPHVFDNNGTLSVHSVTAVEKKIPVGIYDVLSTMSGVKFVKKTLSSDNLLEFADPRRELVLTEFKKFWESAPQYKEMGLIHKRGFILHGPPGSGKTCVTSMAAKESIRQGVCVFYPSSVSALKEGIWDFRSVDKSTRVLVILEDFDEIASYSEHSLLELLDGPDQHSGVAYVGTTNYLNRLSPRIMRSGRFDRKLFVGQPPIEGRLAYLTHKLPKSKFSEVQVKEIAEATSEFSFADLKELVISLCVYGYSLEESIFRIRNPMQESRR
jgi:hypothetical protein